MWTDLKDRFAQNKLPLVLAGPILRQGTQTSVTVWVALLRGANVTLNIYDSDTASQDLMHGSLKTTPIGVIVRNEVRSLRTTWSKLHFQANLVSTKPQNHLLLIF